MSQFEQVSVIKDANVYFDGQVTSRTLKFADGSTKTLGIMLPGLYEFSTGDRELMEIYSGRLELRLSAGDEWQMINGGEEFEVAANSKFSVKVLELTDYCCSFIK